MKDLQDKIIELMDLFDDDDTPGMADGGRIGFADGLPKNIRLTPGGQYRFSTEAGTKKFSKVFSKGTKLEEVVKFRDEYLENLGIKKGQLRQVNPDRGKYVGVEGEKHIKFNGVTYQVAVQRMKDGKMVTEKPFYTTDLNEAKEVRDERVAKAPPKVEKGVFNPDREKEQKKVEKRRAQQKLQEGRLIKYKAPKGYQVHHIMPLAGYRDMTDKDIAVISAKMNQEIAQFNKPINKLVEEAENLNFDETKSLSRLQEINEELAEIVKNAEKKLGLKYKGLIGFNKLTPVLDTFDDKGRQVFSAEPVGIDYSKTVGGKFKKATKIKDISTPELQKLVSEAPVTDLKEQFLKNLENKKFRRVTDVVVKASQDGGFGEVVQKICKRRTSKKGGRMFFAEGPGCPAARDDPKGFLRSISDNPQLAKFLKSGPGKKAMTMAARVSGSVLNPTTLIGGEVAFVLGEGLNNFASGLPLDESFDRAFVFGDFGKFEENLMNKAKELGYDDNQLNLLQQTININKLDNKKRKLEYGLDVEKQDPSGLTSDATMGFENSLDDTNKQLDGSVYNYLDTLDKMGFDSGKASDQETGFRYLDNVFKKRTQDQLVKDFEDRKRQVNPADSPVADFLNPLFDLQAYTQPFKYLADVVNPFTKNVPFLSDRQREAKYLKEMDPRELYLRNKQRKFTLDDIEAGTSPYIREVMEQLGTDVTGQGFYQYAGGGIAGLSGGIDEGPQRRSMNPDSQGLSGLLKRGIKG